MQDNLPHLELPEFATVQETPTDASLGASGAPHPMGPDIRVWPETLGRPDVIRETGAKRWKVQLCIARCPRANSGREFLQCPRNLEELIRFANEPSASRQSAFGHCRMAGSDNELDRGPSIPNDVRKPKTVHGTWHLNVSEHEPNVVTTFQDTNCLVGIRRLDRIKSSLLDHLHGV